MFKLNDYTNGILLTVPSNNLVTDEAEIAEQLMIMSLAISEALFLIMAMTQEGFLAFRTHKVLYMPVFSQSCYHTLFYWTSTSSANWDAHFIVASQAVQLVLKIIKIIKIDIKCKKRMLHIKYTISLTA